MRPSRRMAASFERASILRDAFQSATADRNAPQDEVGVCLPARADPKAPQDEALSRRHAQSWLRASAVRSVAAAIHALEVAAGLHGGDRFGLALFLLLLEFRIVLLGLGPALAVERIDEADVVEAADVVQVPELHRVDALGVGVLALGLLVDVGDRSHGGIEPGLELGREVLVDPGRLRAVELPFLGVALLDDVDALLRLGLEEMDALDDALEEALDDVGMLLDEGQACGDRGVPDHRQWLDVDHLEP